MTNRIMLVLLTAITMICATFAICADSVYAEGIENVLVIDSVDAAMIEDESYYEIREGDTISVSPGSTLSIKIKLENMLFSEGTDDDIQDIFVESIIEDLSDDDAIEAETEPFDMSGGTSKTVELTFSIPLRIHTDERYPLIIIVEGEGANGTLYETQIAFEVYTDKDRHDIRFTQANLIPITAAVNAGDTATVQIGLINVGENDEDVTLTVVGGTDLNFLYTENFTLLEDIDDLYNEYHNNISFEVPENLTTDVYPIWIYLEYDRGMTVLTEILPLEVYSITDENISEEENTDDFSDDSLIITDVIAKVDGDTDSGADETGGTIDNDVYPGSKLELKIKLENLLEDLDIEDIDVEGVIEGLDDGSDVIDDVEISDINGGDTETVTLTFNIPEDADKDDYTLTVTAEGTDENNTAQYATVSFTVEVDKKDHDVTIGDTDLGASVLSCSKSTSLDVEMKNLGEDAEEDMKLKVSNDALGIDVEEYSINIDEDDSYSKTVTIEVGDASAGIYTLDVFVYYSSGNLADSGQVTLEVEDCAKTITKTTTKTTASSALSSAASSSTATTKPSAANEEDVVISYTSAPSYSQLTSSGARAVAINTKAQQTRHDASFTGGSGYLALLAVSSLIVIVLIAIFTVFLLRKN